MPLLLGSIFVFCINYLCAGWGLDGLAMLCGGWTEVGCMRESFHPQICLDGLAMLHGGWTGGRRQQRNFSSPACQAVLIFVLCINYLWAGWGLDGLTPCFWGDGQGIGCRKNLFIQAMNKLSHLIFVLCINYLCSAIRDASWGMDRG